MSPGKRAAPLGLLGPCGQAATATGRDCPGCGVAQAGAPRGAHTDSDSEESLRGSNPDRHPRPNPAPNSQADSARRPPVVTPPRTPQPRKRGSAPEGEQRLNRRGPGPLPPHVCAPEPRQRGAPTPRSSSCRRGRRSTKAPRALAGPDEVPGRRGATGPSGLSRGGGQCCPGPAAGSLRPPRFPGRQVRLPRSAGRGRR